MPFIFLFLIYGRDGGKAKSDNICKNYFLLALPTLC